MAHKKKYSKKRYSRRKSSKKNMKSNTTVVRGPKIIPDRYICKMPYVFTTTISSSSGAVGSNLYRGNGPYDPLQSTGGAQPLGYDQLSALYNRYAVTGCAIELQVLPNTDDGNSICDIVLYPSSTTTVSNSNDNNAEQPYSKRLFLNLSGGKNTTVKHYMTTGAMYGVSKSRVVNDDTFAALSNSLPTDQWYWIVAAQSPDRSSTETYIYKVKLTYYVQWFDRVKLTGS